MFAGSMSLVRRLHKENRFDCIDAHYVYPDGFAAALLGKKLGIPVIISARGTDINVFPSFKLILAHDSVDDATLRGSSGALANR